MQPVLCWPFSAVALAVISIFHIICPAENYFSPVLCWLTHWTSQKHFKLYQLTHLVCRRIYSSFSIVSGWPLPGQPNICLNNVNTVYPNKTRRTLRHYMALHFGQRFLFDNVVKLQFSLFQISYNEPTHYTYLICSLIWACQRVYSDIYRLFTNVYLIRSRR